jgi:hypothetical protein
VRVEEARGSGLEDRAEGDVGGGGRGFVLWHRDRDGLSGDEGEDDGEQIGAAVGGEAQREQREEEGWGLRFRNEKESGAKEEGEEEEEGCAEEAGAEEEEQEGGGEEGDHFMLSEEWMERFARTEVVRQLRDKERRREARRQERPMVPAAVAAEQRVAAVLAARRAAEQHQPQQLGVPNLADPRAAPDEAVALYGVEGAALIRGLEAKLNADYDAVVDLRAPPHWPCEPLNG